MPLQKTEALVLRSIKLGETSKILTLYGRATGKLKVIAKGARSGKSRFGGSLEPINYISIIYYWKETRELQFLSQAEIINTFRNIKADLEKTTVASAVCEIVDRVGLNEEPNPRLFRLFLEVLTALNQSQQNYFNLFRAFQIRLLTIDGVHANFDTCLQCGRRFDTAVSFVIDQGGYFCSGCKSGANSGILLLPESLSSLRVLQASALPQVSTAVVSSPALQQIDAVLDAYLKYHFDWFGELKSVRFYKQMEF